VRKDFYNRWVKEDVHKALFVSFEQEAQHMLEKYLDEVEATLDNRTVKDPITNEERSRTSGSCARSRRRSTSPTRASCRFARKWCGKAMGAYKRGEKFTLGSHALLHDAVEQYLFEQRRDVLRLVSSTTRPDEEVRQKISVVEKRLVDEYGYDAHSAREALNYVTTLLAQNEL
jgi:serine protein kinase